MSDRIIFKQENNMRCKKCQEAMNRQTASIQIDRKGVHLKFDSVPAWICRNCKETYYEESGVESIQAIIKAIDQEAENLTGPHESLC